MNNKNEFKFKITRFRFFLAFIFLAVLLLVVAGVLLEDGGEVKVEVLDYGDQYQIGRVTWLEVRVTNSRVKPVNPVFSLQWGGYQVLWEAETLHKIESGESVTFRLLASREGQLPPVKRTEEGRGMSVPFVVKVNNAGEAKYWVSESVVANLPYPVLLNPDFAVWPERKNTVTLIRSPSGWHTFERAEGKNTVETDKMPGGGITLKVDVYSNEREDWTEVGTVQEIDLRQCPTLFVTVERSAPYKVVDDIWPILVTGIELRDLERPEPYAWVVLDEGPSRQYYLPNGQFIFVVSMPEGKWNTIRVPVKEIFESLNMELPRKGFVKVFLAVHQRSPGTYYAKFKAVSCSLG